MKEMKSSMRVRHNKEHGGSKNFKKNEKNITTTNQYQGTQLEDIIDKMKKILNITIPNIKEKHII
jgi:hypothetical protein